MSPNRGPLQSVETDVEKELAALKTRVEALEKVVVAVAEKTESRIVAAFKHIGHDIRAVIAHL